MEKQMCHRFRDESSIHLEFVKTTVLVFLVLQHIVFTARPFLMVITLALELLRQVIKTLQPADEQDSHSYDLCQLHYKVQLP